MQINHGKRGAWYWRLVGGLGLIRMANLSLFMSFDSPNGPSFDEFSLWISNKAGVFSGFVPGYVYNSLGLLENEYCAASFPSA